MSSAFESGNLLSLKESTALSWPFIYVPGNTRSSCHV
jgi:hypothetical protein